MATLSKGWLVFSAGLLLLLYANAAISQNVPNQGSTLPVTPPSSSPTVSSPPLESSPLPPQQTLLSSKTVVGVVVNNAQGEKIGTIREIMIDPASGQVMYAVVDSVGAFGFGKQKSFAVPWKGLHLKLDQTEITVQLDQDRFPSLPSVALNKPQS